MSPRAKPIAKRAPEKEPSSARPFFGGLSYFVRREIKEEEVYVDFYLKGKWVETRQGASAVLECLELSRSTTAWFLLR
jgi:hypothetical protein